MTEAKTHTTEKPQKDHFLAISIVIAALIIGGSVIYATGVKNTPQGAVVANTPPPTSNATVDDDVILGSPDAPVTIIEFGDYQCPYCGAFYGVEEQLRDEYIATGKVKMVFRDFPLTMHPEARPAAEAAECAGDQEAYWLYHDALFTRQQELPTLDYVALAGELGLDETSFEACFTSGTHADEVERDLQDGIAAGVKGTPTSFINGRFVEGALPYSSLQALIEEALSAS